jgi:hypothetical protein
MDLLLILFWLALIVGILKLLKIFKLPISKNAAALLLLIGVAGLAWQYGYLAGVIPSAPVASTTPVAGVPTFAVTGSESDSYLTYNETDRVFTVNVTENTTSGACSPDNVTFTLTIRRTDTLNDVATAVATITSSVPGYMNERTTTDTTTYYPVTKTGSEFNVEITPSGGTMNRESHQVALGLAASTTVSVTVRISDDIDKLNLYNSKDVIVNAAGTQFRIRILLNSQVA